MAKMFKVLFHMLGDCDPRGEIAEQWTESEDSGCHLLLSLTLRVTLGLCSLLLLNVTWN